MLLKRLRREQLDMVAHGTSACALKAALCPISELRQEPTSAGCLKADIAELDPPTPCLRRPRMSHALCDRAAVELTSADKLVGADLLSWQAERAWIH
jgi:hypothetical protein